MNAKLERFGRATRKSFSRHLWLVLPLTVVANGQSTPQVESDPIGLLRAVADARLRITSGSVSLEITRTQAEPLRATPDRRRLNIAFDGQNRQVEEFWQLRLLMARNGDRAATAEAKLRELEGDWDALIRLGLGSSDEQRLVTIYDGTAAYRYSDGWSRQVSIMTPLDVTKYGFYTFDPRVLGLLPLPAISDTVESSLGYTRADSVRLLGSEKVGPRDTWHLQVRTTPADSILELWIDVKRPTHVLKAEAGGHLVIVSRYDDANPGDPLPLESIVTINYPKPRSHVTRIVRRATTYEVSFDSSAWTLAGFGMPVGTPIYDRRTPNRKGHWDGSRFVEEIVRPPPTNSLPPVEAPAKPAPK